MKSIINIFLANILIFTLFSCDEDDVKSLADVEISSSISKNIVVNVEEGGQNINNSVSINLANEDLADYMDKLKELQITKIEGTLEDFSGSNNGTQLDLAFKLNNETITNVIIYDAYAEIGNILFEITEHAQLQNISDQLLENQSIDASIEGTYQSMQNAQLNFIITIYFDVVANPL